MKEKKKNTDAKADRKRLFMRMKSPSAFGAARRFDSASFMNVPPEMARRDAAYSCFAAYFRQVDLKDKTAAERHIIYQRILRLFELIERKSEFILSSDTIEKRNLQAAGSLAFVRVLHQYFMTLNDLAAAQAATSGSSQSKNGLLSGDFFNRLNPQLRLFEDELIVSIRLLMEQKRELLLAQKEQRRKDFSKSDSERYERAFSLYTEYYSNLENV